MDSYNPNDYYNSNFDNNANNFGSQDFMDGSAGFESGNPVVKTLYDVKSVYVRKL